MDFQRKETYDIDDLCRIMEILRSPEGCPWDREQTHQSIRRDLIEETYEAAEAIDLQDAELLREELGDVLLQVVFHARIEEESGHFNFSDVVNEVSQKLVIRHPHVFSDVEVQTSDEVLDVWETIKNETKGRVTAAQTLASVPAVFPALIRAEKVQKRAAKAGMDEPDWQASMQNLQSELSELTEAIASGKEEAMDEELGDLLFSCVNLARHLGIGAEESLGRSCEKFIQRISILEMILQKQGMTIADADAQLLDDCWRQAKAKLERRSF